MLEGLMIMAIVVAPTPPPTPPSQQQSCQYSAMINDNSRKPIYQCYSQEEWDARNAHIAAEEAREAAETKAYWESVPGWWRENWWKVLLGIFGLFVALVVASIIDDKIDEKRNPWDYPRF